MTRRRCHLHDMIIRSRPQGVGARAIEGPICNLGSSSIIPKDDAYRLVSVVRSDPICMPRFKGRKNFGYGSRLIFSDAANQTLIPRSLRARRPRPASRRFRVRDIQFKLMLGGRKQHRFNVTKLMPIWTFVACRKIAAQPVNLHNHNCAVSVFGSLSGNYWSLETRCIRWRRIRKGWPGSARNK